MRFELKYLMNEKDHPMFDLIRKIWAMDNEFKNEEKDIDELTKNTITEMKKLGILPPKKEVDGFDTNNLDNWLFGIQELFIKLKDLKVVNEDYKLDEDKFKFLAETFFKQKDEN